MYAGAGAGANLKKSRCEEEQVKMVEDGKVSQRRLGIVSYIKS
jgi:hypothetical protein